ncbi:MAG: DMT family transporter [Gemmatimonadaceae bacterium]|nr:DMT family transporter [Chitinophagaceae bacterium]
MKKSFLRLHAAIFLAGFTGILGRLITLNEGLLVWYRMLFSAVALWLIALFYKKLQTISHADKLRIAGIGFIAALHWLTFYASIKYSNVSVALVCFSAVGFFTAVIEPLIFRKKFVIAELGLGLLVIAGIFIIFQFDTRYKTGIVIGVVSAMLAALFPILNRPILQRVTAETLTTWEITGGFLCLTLIMPFYLYLFPVATILPTQSDFFWLLFLALFCTVLAFQLSALALQKLSAFTVNLSYNLEPVYGILLAFVIYAENRELGISFYAGITLIVLAVVLQTLRFAHQRKTGVGKI